MTDDDLIEAIREAAGYALHREAARRVLEVIRPKGWRVVPVKPCASMVDAAAHLIFIDQKIEAAIAAAPSPPRPRKTDTDPMRETF